MSIKDNNAIKHPPGFNISLKAMKQEEKEDVRKLKTRLMKLDEF